MHFNNSQLGCELQPKHQYALDLRVGDRHYTVIMDRGGANERVFVLPDLKGEAEGASVEKWLVESLQAFYATSSLGLRFERGQT